jgi:DNA-binding CsgD family transcriptional regulator
VTVGTNVELVGREAELAQLSRLADLTAGSRGVVIRGEAGIGKTALWRAALDAAERAAVRVLATRCAEAEMPIAFGGLADLLEEAFDDVSQDLPAPQREALGVAIGMVAPDDHSYGIALPRALLAALRLLARRAPVLVAVDDVQWLDPPSRRVLAFAARRLGDEPIGLLATHRGDDPDPLELARALEEPRFDEIRLGPLTIGALNLLVRSRLGVRIPRPVLARVHEASGGNPMFALEFARAFSGPGAVPPGPLPIPTSLEELVHERVARHPPEIRHLLAVAAAMERPTLATLASTVGGTDALLEVAFAAGALTMGDDGVVRFAHPLLAAASYTAVAPSERRALHAQIAAVAENAEERARHLALATVEPDADVAARLDVAAARASVRGAPEAAAELEREAIRLTPATDVSGREERALAAVGHLIAAGAVAEASTMLKRLLAGPVSGPRRTHALLAAYLIEPDQERATTLVQDAMRHAGADPYARTLALLSVASDAWHRGDEVASEATARQALASAEACGDPQLRASAMAAVAARAASAGRPEPELMRESIRLADTHGSLPRMRSPRFVLGKQLLWAGDLAGARELLESELDRLARRGDDYVRAALLAGELFQLEWRAGHWDIAEQHLDDAWELSESADRYVQAKLLLERGLLAASRGDVDVARSLMHGALAFGQSLHLARVTETSRWVLGFLALSLRDYGEAAEALEQITERFSPEGAEGTPEVWIALPDMVEALVGSGRLEDAEARSAHLATHAHALEHRWANPASLRCEALLRLARANAGMAVARADEAAAAFEIAGFPLDHGRALLVAGEALRRLGERRMAASRLEAAKGIFSKLGAGLWLERAEHELRRANPRPRRDRGLTAAEHHVAVLVSEGRTNREVAAQQFTTVATVEAHLTRIYRKLGLRSRTELARRVADGTLDLGAE